MTRRGRKREAGETSRVSLTDEGLSLEVVDPREPETADFIVCLDYSYPMMFSDNQTTRCHDCQKLLQMRPYNPRKPKKVCMSCAKVRIAAPPLQ